ncbi:MAG: hypothetical protein K8F52_11905 [Candidatus Scalindua rubra]|uniref:Uncharacterized protein n=1 Tax=Candidatus Scalindua brodae TaxID=237368 RepID=A0A0B0EEH8_9BACT|nr:MAG: hypothetical protein SCABRO_03776 [Candidatus Scalindua brodae]MBZ0109361.1 hypothetical protein [Candidatus Scalindua rubra]
MTKNIDKLIINTPYEEPKHYWFYDRENRDFQIRDGRRPAGYVMATPNSKAFDDPGIFVEIDLVNKIRPRVKLWRETGYPGVTGITKRLLEHWQDPEERRDRRFFFCQLEAIEIEEDESTPKLTKKQQAELLRQTVDSVGKIGQPGEQIQNVI